MDMEPGLWADPLRLRGKFKTFWILSYILHVMSVFSCLLSWKRPSFGTQKLRDLRGGPWVNNTDSQHANVLRNPSRVYSWWLKIVDLLKVAAVFWKLLIRGRSGDNWLPSLTQRSLLIFLCWSNTLFGGLLMFFPKPKHLKIPDINSVPRTSYHNSFPIVFITTSEILPF